MFCSLTGRRNQNEIFKWRGLLQDIPLVLIFNEESNICQEQLAGLAAENVRCSSKLQTTVSRILWRKGPNNETLEFVVTAGLTATRVVWFCSSGNANTDLSCLTSKPDITDELGHCCCFVVVVVLVVVFNCIVSLGFLPWEIRVAFPGESQLRQSCAKLQCMLSVLVFP